MKKNKKVLFVGETCVAQSTEFKGFDNFHCIRYNESAVILKNILEKKEYEVTHIPCHLVPFQFPNTIEKLEKYSVIIVSDVGANTFLLHPDTSRLCKRTPNLLKLIRTFVERGGGFIMVGGYMTFQGIEAKGKYKDSPIEEILPVNLLTYDDRVEVPEGADLEVDPEAHVILKGLPAKWPFILGYNKLIPKEDAQVVVKYENDPIIALGKYKEGRTIAYATDCAPHWAPMEMYQWEYYDVLWDNLVKWVSKGI